MACGGGKGGGRASLVWVFSTGLRESSNTGMLQMRAEGEVFICGVSLIFSNQLWSGYIDMLEA